MQNFPVTLQLTELTKFFVVNAQTTNIDGNSYLEMASLSPQNFSLLFLIMNLSTAHLFGSECALSKTEIKTEFVVVFNLRVQRICNIWKLSYVEKSFPTQNK